MYCIFSNFGGGKEIFLYSQPLTPKYCLGGYKNGVTEMIHLLTFQSINNVLYFFFNFGGYRNIFLYPHPLQKNLFFKFQEGIEIFFYTPTPLHPKKLFWGGYKK